MVSVLSENQSQRRKIENPDRTLADFEIIRPIGTGTFGKVYLAILDGRPVAIKSLRKSQLI